MEVRCGVHLTKPLKCFASRQTRLLALRRLGRHRSKINVRVHVTVFFGCFAAGTGILSSVAILRLPLPFACTTTLECHYPRVPLPSPAQPESACSLTSSSNFRNCPQSVCRTPPPQNSKASTLPSYLPPTLHYHNGTCFFRFGCSRK